MAPNKQPTKREKLVEGYPSIRILGALAFAAASYYFYEAVDSVKRTKNKLLPGRDYRALKAEYNANIGYFEDVQIMFTDEEFEAWRAD